MTQKVDPPPPPTGSPPWSLSVKIGVAVIAIIIIFLLGRRFTGLLGQLVVAAMMAYLLSPLYNMVADRTPLRRTHTILLTYLVVAVLVVGMFVALGVAAYTQTLNFIDEAPALVDQVLAFVGDLVQRQEPLFAFGDFEFRLSTVDWNTVRDQVLGLFEPLFSRSGQILGSVAQSAVRTIGVLAFVFIISIYIALEIPQLGGYVARAAQQPGYREDAERLMRHFNRIWNAYLRGQVILGIAIFVVVWLGLAVLGVNNALALGILSGLLEFIPVIGPIVGAGVAIIVAFFQPSNYLGLGNVEYALIVLIFMLIVQQVENNVLVPRIVGGALDLHPLLVMIGVFMGGSLAGILGAILAAPVMATLKLMSLYAWRKMFDLPPFPDPEPTPPAESVPLLARWQAVIGRLRRS